MIRQLTLQNFRAFEDHTVPLRSETIIVGENNAGKSTIVEALRLLSLVINRREFLHFSNVPSWLDISRRERGVSPSLRNMEINLKSIFHRYGEPPAQISATFDSGENVTLYVGPEGELHGVFKDSKGQLIATQREARNLSLPTISILPQVGPLAREEELLNPAYVMRAMGSSLAPLHFRNQLNLFPDRFEEFKKLAQSSWSGLRIKTLERRGHLPDDVELSLLVQDSGFVAEVGWMGHGLQMWLQAIWFLTYTTPNDVVILDEPDVYMHADLQRRLIRLVRGRYNQIIIATHSTEILAEVEPDQVLVVDRRKRKSTFTTTLPAVQHVIHRIGSAHNIHLARLWSARKFLMVEGKDIGLLQRIQNTLFPESKSPFDAIPNTAIGGWSGWKYVIGSKLFMKNAGGDEIITYCILDSDYYTREQIDARLGEALEHNIELHIWSCKEIENYLIAPTAIERIILSRLRKSSDGLLIDEINERISQITAELHDETLDAIATDFFTQNRALGLATANRYARERVNAAWKTIGGRLSLVSGKTMVSELSKWGKETYGVSFSSSRIAQELTHIEIDPELITVVAAIENCEPLIVAES